jgi:hypothetical protein
MIEYIIIHEHKEFNYKDIRDVLEVSPPSVYTGFKTCKEFGLILETRKIGPSTLYKTNTKSPLYPILKKLVMNLSIKKYEVEIDGKQ